MHRRILEKLAARLKSTKPIGNSGSTQWRVDVEAVADIAEDENPRFDRERFLKACGLTTQAT